MFECLRVSVSSGRRAAVEIYSCLCHQHTAMFDDWRFTIGTSHVTHVTVSSGHSGDVGIDIATCVCSGATDSDWVLRAGDMVVIFVIVVNIGDGIVVLVVDDRLVVMMGDVVVVRFTLSDGVDGGVGRARDRG